MNDERLFNEEMDQGALFRIKGHHYGDNLSCLNVMYHKRTRDDEGKLGPDSIDIIYKDLDTGEKGVHHINNPKYVYYMAKPQYATSYNRFYAPVDELYSIKVEYKNLRKSIAERLGGKALTDYQYYIETGQYTKTDFLFRDPRVFMADMNIEDHYRFHFNLLYQNNTFAPTKMYIDIEVDTIDMIDEDFPSPGRYPVNACSLLDENSKTIFTLLLENYNNRLIDDFKSEEHVVDSIKDRMKEKMGDKYCESGIDKFKIQIAFYDEEVKLIHTIFNIINTLKPDFVLAWNMAFDIPYLINRIASLGYNPTYMVCHKDFKIKECYYYLDQRAKKFEEKGDFAQISSYSVFIDQLITFASRRKGQRQIPSYKLDFVSTYIAGIGKYDYSHITTKIAELPYKDYKVFVTYNILDVVCQYLIEQKTSDVDFVLNVAIDNNVRYSKVHRQTTYLVNGGIKTFYERGLIMGCNINKHNTKTEFAGAFVADPIKVSDKPKMTIYGNPVNICDNCVDFDYARLYPSIIEENNVAPFTQYGKIIIEEKINPNENQFNNPYFDRSVKFMEDYISGDVLNFCHRYLGYALYTEMISDIIEYFTTIRMPNYPIGGYGHCQINLDKKIMAMYLPIEDNGRKKIMCSIIKERPNDTNIE